MGRDGIGLRFWCVLVCCWLFPVGRLASLVLEASAVSYHVVFLPLFFFRFWRDKIGIRCLHALYLKLNGVVFLPPPCDSGRIGLQQCLHQNTKVFCFSAEFLATQACLWNTKRHQPFVFHAFYFWCDQSNCIYRALHLLRLPAFSCSPLLIKSNQMKPFDFSFDDIKSFITPPTSWTLVPALALLCLARRLPCLLVCLPPCLDQIDVMDYDDIGGDELIGRTVIDLEDRWFDQRWQVLRLRHYDVFLRQQQHQNVHYLLGMPFLAANCCCSCWRGIQPLAA